MKEQSERNVSIKFIYKCAEKSDFYSNMIYIAICASMNQMYMRSRTIAQIWSTSMLSGRTP